MGNTHFLVVVGKYRKVFRVPSFQEDKVVEHQVDLGVEQELVDQVREVSLQQEEQEVAKVEQEVDPEVVQVVKVL